MANALQELADTGVAVWLDDLSRERIQSGELTRLVEHGVVGITTNPTIFAKAIGSGAGYEEQVQDLALRGTAVGETVRLLTAWDVRSACDVLQPTAARTGGRDGRVSIEVDPRIRLARQLRRAGSGGSSIDLTSLSRSQRPSQASLQLRKRWQRASPLM